ncbi:hypothetical protein IWX76_002981 [Pedobacter sp. CAN_A7]|uniref:DUF4838 domain-containing protein n=1 Tax=Pedobacter sp. CAN_A7 TaxID=2787722 RepID=UPI0018C99831
MASINHLHWIFCSLVFTLLREEPVVLVSEGKSEYKIVIASAPTEIDKLAASVFQKYIRQMSGAELQIVPDSTKISEFEVQIGKSNRTAKEDVEDLTPDGLLIKTRNRSLILTGGTAKGVLFSVYAFLEKYLGCRKYDIGLPYIPERSSITLAKNLELKENPTLQYRDVFYPQTLDVEYRNWHKLHTLDDSWGLWGHTFNLLVPAIEYFANHPEYYAWVDGERKPTQLCLSNSEVFAILTANLRLKIENNPGLTYWSVSQNDGVGYCECKQCARVDKRQGGPQGSIIKFVNKVAADFPDKIISTLAYGYSQKAPKHLKPVSNVNVLFSSIVSNRNEPIATDPRSESFRKDLKDWTRLTKNLIIWDYVIQFTNQVSPFPNLRVLKPNMELFKNAGVYGVFSQGSGYGEAEFSVLRSYLLAKLSWDSQLNATEIVDDFVGNYYGEAAPFIHSYIDLIHQEQKMSSRVLGIYGSPVREHLSYLRPELIALYNKIFDEGEAVVATNAILLERVRIARLPLQYAELQLSKFYGIGEHGVFLMEGNRWEVKPGYQEKVNHFTNLAIRANIKEISESGLSPANYQKEWKQVFKDGPKLHQALHAEVKAVIPFSDEYVNKGTATLTDGSRGYGDHEYNWLGWVGGNMEVVVNLGKEMVINQVGLSFLDDQRHLAFVPEVIEVSFSIDGQHFQDLKTVHTALEEHPIKSIKDINIALPERTKARFVKVFAKNVDRIPSWIVNNGRSAWIFIDEIMVN